jgi:uncharacterized membrane protein YhhN
LSEERKRLFRNANIGILVGAVLLISGAILFHKNDDAYSASAVVSFVIGMIVYLGLSVRDERAGRMGPRQ